MTVFVMLACLQTMLVVIVYVMQGFVRVLLKNVDIVVHLTNKLLIPHVV